MVRGYCPSALDQGIRAKGQQSLHELLLLPLDCIIQQSFPVVAHRVDVNVLLFNEESKHFGLALRKISALENIRHSQACVSSTAI